MKPESASPRRRAAAVVPRLPDGRVLVGVRTTQARSWPGTVAFPGGAMDPDDARLPTFWPGSDDRSDRSERACALRELAEEVGLWRLCRRDGAVDIAATRRVADAVRGGATLGPALDREALVLDDRDLLPLQRWLTRDGSFSVLQTLLPLTTLPVLSPPLVDELSDIDFRSPADLVRGWRDGTVYLIPPIRRVLQALAVSDDDDDALARLRVPPSDRERELTDLVPGIAMFPARSPTLWPATHTNGLLLGAGNPLWLDPAAIDDAESEKMDAALSRILGSDRRLAGIFLTHHHMDHAKDAARLRDKHGVPVYAHALTAERVDCPVDVVVDEGYVFVTDGDPERRFRCVFTPGHAPGHLCLFEEHTRVLIAGDMVAGTGSILIDPPDGHMGTYLASLRRLIALSPRAILPAHGPLLTDGVARLEEQLAHRKKRQRSVLDVVPGAADADDGVDLAGIVRAVYGADTPAHMFPLAERSVRAIVELLVEEGSVVWRGSRVVRA